jgi:hypothetical protein
LPFLPYTVKILFSFPEEQLGIGPVPTHPAAGQEEQGHDFNYNLTRFERYQARSSSLKSSSNHQCTKSQVENSGLINAVKIEASSCQEWKNVYNLEPTIYFLFFYKGKFKHTILTKI